MEKALLEIKERIAKEAPATAQVVYPVVKDGGQETNVEEAEATAGVVDSDVQAKDTGTKIQAVRYSLDKLAKNFNFSSAYKDVKGGGYIYCGGFSPDPLTKQEIAIQAVTHTCTDFMDEVQRLDRRRHVNLISLIGYCNVGNPTNNEETPKNLPGRNLFVFDYIPPHLNLRSLIRDRPPGVRPLNWKERMHIAICVARALNFLHHGADRPIVYGYLRPFNVLVSKDYTVIKLADVRHIELAYAPGYEMKETEVYSYGVLLLELLTGMTSYYYEKVEDRMVVVKLIDTVRRNLTDEEILNIVDPLLAKWCTKRSVEKLVALAMPCVSDSPDLRPTMAQILKDLEEAVPLMDAWNTTFFFHQL